MHSVYAVFTVVYFSHFSQNPLGTGVLHFIRHLFVAKISGYRTATLRNGRVPHSLVTGGGVV